MPNPPSSLPLFEYLGAAIVQDLADAALGPGAVTFSADPSGLSMRVALPAGETITIDGVGVGAQGFSGRLLVEGAGPDNPLQTTIFDGFAIGLTAFDVTLSDGSFSQSAVAGQFQTPFFSDGSGKPRSVGVELGFNADGGFSVGLAATQTASPTTPDGLVQLSYEIGGGATTVEIDVALFEIDQTPRGDHRIVLSGRLSIGTADLRWPSFELRGLGIDSKGGVSIDGGWIDLPNQTGLDFFGFHIALHKLGLGSDANGRWIGFNGDIHLVEGLPLGGSVRGLRIDLENGSVSLDGVQVEFAIAGVLSIRGEIDHIHVDASSPDDLRQAGLLPSIFDQVQNAPGQPALPKKIDVFAGKVDVAVEILPGLEITGKFIVGHFGGSSVFFLDLDVDLPVGVPIFLDVSLYGLEGLIASNLEPHPEPQNTWWEWYKYPTGSSGIDTGAAPDFDATDVKKWLAPKQGALAIGAGATIGTSVDDGFTVSAAITFVLMLPGPVIALIGKANILSKRIGGPGDDANFDALAVYDGNTKTFDIAIDAHYQIPAVLEVDGTGELRVAPSENPTWFFALGLPPHEKRLKARLFDLFETDAYFVVSSNGLITGTWTGYRNSWSFGPLSVSLDAYLATLAAIQWSPLQIAGGIELHGDIHLDAFGIGMGVTADALLEGCAPNPFWVHGEVSVELDLPWPLPNVGATISLTWGGDDGEIPPAPLALNHVVAIVADHTDKSGGPVSDHYVLLAHRPGGPWPDPTVQYDDPNRPGILALDSSNDQSWRDRVKPGDLRAILPDLNPNALQGRYAPVVPQDAHFVLTFARPVVDAAGFDNATSPPPEDPVPAIPTTSFVGKDDMSNINPQPPAVQFQYRHSLLQVAIFEHKGGAWQFLCAMPQLTEERKNAPLGATFLGGTWQAAADAHQRQTQVKVFPYRMLPGEAKFAAWSGSGGVKTLGTRFQTQDLAFQLDAGLLPGTIGQTIAFISQPGLAITYQSGSGRVQIAFPAAVKLTGIVSLIMTRDGEFTFWSAPSWSGDGAPLTPASTAQDAFTREFTQIFSPGMAPIQKLAASLGSRDTMVLYTMDYRLPDVKMTILPDAPALYAIQTVTRIEAGRVNNGGVTFSDVTDGNPVVEFAYVQTASGPGAAIVAALPPNPMPPYLRDAQYPSLNGQPSPATFPLGGALEDLATYGQWSWPEDGALAAYFGYEVNVEFVETYVNALYGDFPGDGIQNHLHFRCVDRNQRYAPLDPVAIHVPSIYPANALVAQEAALDLPAVVAAALQDPPLRVVPEALAVLAQRATLAPKAPLIPGLETSPKVDTAAQLNFRTGAFYARQVSPRAAAGLLHVLESQADAATFRSLWFRPLAPQTRYTLDVLVGPFASGGEDAPPGSLSAIYAASDAAGALSALKAYYTYENALPPLLRVQFATSRYATFADQMANVAAQIGAGKPATAPIRHYVAATDPSAWLASPSNPNVARLPSGGPDPQDPYSTYLSSRDDLAAAVASLAAQLLTLDGANPGGAGTLSPKRQAVATAWSAFSAATSGVFDGLIAALGRPDLISNARPPPPLVPDAELSIFMDASFKQTFALLVESPEPLPWRRLWRWIQLTPDGGATSVINEKNVLWNADGTRGLLIIEGQPVGRYQLTAAFQGNIGAEAPCITSDGVAVWDLADMGELQLQRPRRRPRPRPAGPH